MILADEIREYAFVCYIKPARRKSQDTINLSARVIHDGMGLQNHFPAVCEAIDTDKFLKYAGVTVASRSGPNQSTTVKWVFRV